MNIIKRFFNKVNIIFSLIYGFLSSGLFCMGLMMYLFTAFDYEWRFKSTQIEYEISKWIWCVLAILLTVCLICHIIHLKRKDFGSEKYARVKRFIFTIMLSLIFAIVFLVVWMMISGGMYDRIECIMNDKLYD